MRPTLVPGDEVLVDPRGTPKPGDIVLCEHPTVANTKMLKRVMSLEERGTRVFVRGDNADESTDSRQFGTLHLRAIKGIVKSRLP